MITITEEDFQGYVAIQMSGVTNMFNVKNVELLSGLTREQILYVMENYKKLSEKYPNVRKRELEEARWRGEGI